MIVYTLKYKNLSERKIHKDFKIVETIDNSIIQYCIDSFNAKIKWDNMFDISEANNRISKGDKMFVAYYEDTIVGYCWMKKYTEDEYYLYNIFINADSTNRNYGATDLTYLIVKNYTKGIIKVDIDEWNYKSQRVAEKVGFKQL